MIDLEVYTLKRPKLTPELVNELGIHHVKTIDNIKGIFHPWRDYRIIYRWVPWPWDVKDSQRPFVNIEVEPLKSRYSIHNEDAADSLVAAKNKGLLIPKGYISLTRRLRGNAANPTAYRYAQAYPDLEKVTDIEPLWGISKLAHGQSTYQISLETPIWASQEAVTKMCALATTFAQRFNGIVWGEGQFGPHNPTQLYQLYNEVNEAVTGLLGKFLDVSPAETE